MKKESNNQNQDLEDKQNIVAVEENTNNTENNVETLQSATELNTTLSLDIESINKLKHQINFSTKILEQQQKEFEEVLNNNTHDVNQVLTQLLEKFQKTVDQSTSQLNNSNILFHKSIQEQLKQYEILKTEVGVLSLVPKKTKEAITNIIPDVARELDKIQLEYTRTLHNSYNSIISSYSEELKKYHIEIDKTSNSITSHITKHISSVDQKLEEYSKKLSASAAHVVECSNYSFLKNMCLVVLFSAIVSGGTAYLVTTKFPRYLTVTDANNVTIQDCDVSVLGKAKDPDNLIEKMTKKKKNYEAMTQPLPAESR